MNCFIYAEKDDTGKIVFELDNFKNLSEEEKKCIKNKYFDLVFKFVKQKLRKKGELKNEIL